MRQEDDKDEKKVEPKAFKPVVRVSSLMAGHALAFDKVQEVLAQKEQTLTQEEEEGRLNALGKWSDVIAELSNVHTQYRRKPAYIEMAAETRSIALQLAGAARAEAPDESALDELSKKLGHSCSVCHDAGF